MSYLDFEEALSKEIAEGTWRLDMVYELYKKHVLSPRQANPAVTMNKLNLIEPKNEIDDCHEVLRQRVDTEQHRTNDLADKCGTMEVRIQDLESSLMHKRGECDELRERVAKLELELRDER